MLGKEMDSFARGPAASTLFGEKSFDRAEVLNKGRRASEGGPPWRRAFTEVTKVK